MTSHTDAGRLAGKRILVTGTGSGQGAAVAKAFCRQGASVAGCDLDEDSAERTAAELATEDYKAFGHTVNLADPDAAHAWVEEGVQLLGGLDVVYNNAAATDFAPFADMTRSVWDFSIRNELDNVFHVCLAAWPHLAAEGGGTIINVGSVSALVADAPMGQSAHTAAKAAVIAFTRQLAAEGGPLGIRANCISPGIIATPATDDIPDPMRAYMIGKTFLGRIGTPADIVPGAIYLASDESSYATGTNLVIDGGWSAGGALGDLTPAT